MKRMINIVLAILIIGSMAGCKQAEVNRFDGLNMTRITISDICSSNSGARCEIGPENQAVLDTVAALFPKSSIYPDDIRIARPYYVQISLADGETLSLMYGDDAGRMTVIDPKSEYNIENPELTAYFSEAYEKYNQLADEVMVPEEDSLPPVYAFTKSDIEAAEKAITDYYAALANKDAEALVALMHPRFGYSMEKYESGELTLWDTGDLELLAIHPYDSAFQQNFNYHMDAGDGNTMILKVDFEVSFPDGDTNSCYSEGTYTDWAFILVRADAESPWLVYDQGY